MSSSQFAVKENMIKNEYSYAVLQVRSEITKNDEQIVLLQSLNHSNEKSFTGTQNNIFEINALNTHLQSGLAVLEKMESEVTGFPEKGYAPRNFAAAIQALLYYYAVDTDNPDSCTTGIDITLKHLNSLNQESQRAMFNSH